MTSQMTKNTTTRESSRIRSRSTITNTKMSWSDSVRVNFRAKMQRKNADFEDRKCDPKCRYGMQGQKRHVPCRCEMWSQNARNPNAEISDRILHFPVPLFSPAWQINQRFPNLHFRVSVSFPYVYFESRISYCRAGILAGFGRHLTSAIGDGKHAIRECETDRNGNCNADLRCNSERTKFESENDQCK